MAESNSKWGLIVTLWGAIAAASVNIYLAHVNNGHESDLRAYEIESDRILQALEAENADQSAENLKFLLKVGLITDAATAQGIANYLAEREAGGGAVLPAQRSETDNPPESPAIPNPDVMLGRFEEGEQDELLRKFGILPGDELRPLTPRWTVRDSRNVR